MDGNRRTIIPARRLAGGGSGGGEKLEQRRKRPGLSNLNRRINIIKTVESASLVPSTPINRPLLNSNLNRQAEHNQNLSNNDKNDIINTDNNTHNRKMSEEHLYANNKSGNVSSGTENEKEESMVNLLHRNSSMGRNSELRTKIVPSKSKAAFKSSLEPEDIGFPPTEGSIDTQSEASSWRSSAHNSFHPRDSHILYDYELDLASDLSTMQMQLNSEKDEDLDFFEDDFEISEGNRLRVPRVIYFMKQKRNDKAFVAFVDVENVSQYYVTFSVKTSNPQMFKISPSVSLIEPNGEAKVTVETNPLFEFQFSDISKETFKIFATPLYSSNPDGDVQVRQEQLDILWRAYGSKLFPSIAAESHYINFVCQSKSPMASAMDNVIDRGFLDSPWGNQKPVVVHERPAVTEEEFYHFWPLENDQYTFMISKNQMHGWQQYLHQVTLDKKKWSWNFNKCAGLTALISFTVAVIYCGLFSPPFQYKSPHEWLWPTPGPAGSSSSKDVKKEDGVISMSSKTNANKPPVLFSNENANGFIESIFEIFEASIWM